MKKQMTGGQKNIDMNKNNKIDSEDFKMLRNKKSMAKGGAVKQMAKGGAVKPMAKGGAVKPMAKGGSVKMRGGGMAKGYNIGGKIKTKGAPVRMARATNKRKIDGIAQRGRTRAG
jgi:hypothetical protein|tara:strand:- start:430 stop:774 length:345 start_codon:yes stop_codon:yes gene_type:complete